MNLELLQNLSDEELLACRIKDLGLSLEKSDYYPRVQRVLAGVRERLPNFEPLIFLGDEWFSPEGYPAISIPFFLSHPRLRALEKKLMLECEGEDDDEFERLLLHEMGHAFDHAFRVSRRKSWAEVFGSPRKEYHPENYRPRPYSKNYVQNLQHWYAQAHPDEDFAETMAVWLNPRIHWKEKYRGWGALKKLQYVDDLAKEFTSKLISKPKGRMISEARFLTSTLKVYYQRRQREIREDYPDFYDADLRRIFAEKSATHQDPERAWKFLHRNRRTILNAVSHWTGEKKVVVDELIQQFISRCKQLKLVVGRTEVETCFEISSFLATLVSNYLFTGHFKRDV